MPSRREVIQSGNTAGRDVIGGNSNTVNLGAIAASSRLSLLLERYKHEVERDAKALEMLEELQRYCEPKEDPLVPLETKLEQGGRSDMLPFALETKERFSKQLALHTHYPSAQLIHLHVLSKIWSVFQTRIMPMIREGHSRLVIERLIESEIIEPTLGSLGDNPFNYGDSEIQGMIYYLTGNCHIWWS